MYIGTEPPVPPVVRRPLSAVAPMERAKLPLRNSPPETRVSVSVAVANPTVPAPVLSRLSELSVSAEVPVDKVPVTVLIFTFELLEDSTPVNVPDKVCVYPA